MHTLLRQGAREPRRGEGGELLLKRQAYHRSIRRQELAAYFTNVRTSLIHAEKLENEAVEQAYQLISDLPASVFHLAKHIDEHLLATTAAIIGKIEEVAQKMVRLELPEWGHYMHILQRVLVNISLQEAGIVVRHTLLGALECAQILEKRNRNNPYQCQQIAEHCLEYCLRCGHFLAQLDQLQLGALIWTVKFLGQKQLAAQGRLALMTLCNNLLSAQFDPEQAENIQPHQLRDMQLLKMNFARSVFYEEEHLLKNIVHWTMQALLVQQPGEGNQGERTLVQGLRLLVNITNMFEEAIYYYPLLSTQIIHLVNSYLLARKGTNPTILTVRLLNNLLVNDEKLTMAILKDIHLPLLIKTYDEEGLAVQQEVVGLLVNLVYFLNNDAIFIRDLVSNLSLHILLFEFLPHYQNQDIDEKLILDVLNALIIAHVHHPTVLSNAARQHCDTLREMAENSNLDTQLIETILLWEHWEEKGHL